MENKGDNYEAQTCLQDLIVSLHVLEEDLERGLQGATRAIVIHIVLEHVSVDNIVVHHC